MASAKTATPATACSEPALNIERFAGELDNHSNPTLINIQARRLTRRFAISMPLAIVLASLHYGEAAR
jgi:hypothetical protein